MSTLRAATIADLAGTGPTNLTKQAAAKAWWKIETTAATVNASLNVSSTTDNGVGDTTATYTTAFSSVDYAWLAGTVANGRYSSLVAPQSASFARFLRHTAGPSAEDGITFGSCLGTLA